MMNTKTRLEAKKRERRRHWKGRPMEHSDQLRREGGMGSLGI
jgi:hypothetical protein